MKTKSSSDIRCPSALGTCNCIRHFDANNIENTHTHNTYIHTGISRCFYTQLIGAYASNPIVSSIVFFVRFVPSIRSFTLLLILFCWYFVRPFDQIICQAIYLLTVILLLWLLLLSSVALFFCFALRNENLPR